MQATHRRWGVEYHTLSLKTAVTGSVICLHALRCLQHVAASSTLPHCRLVANLTASCCERASLENRRAKKPRPRLDWLLLLGLEMSPSPSMLWKLLQNWLQAVT